MFDRMIAHYAEKAKPQTDRAKAREAHRLATLRRVYSDVYGN